FERMDSDSDKTKDFDKSSSSVFKSLRNEFEPGGSSYIEGNDLVCYEDFHVSDALFSTINEDKVFNPGILVDKNSKVQVEPKNNILNPKVWICQISQEISQKRTRERMSDQEAKEIKAEAREIMPQPSTVYCS
ncbi:hypothetical protein Tco_1252046, partial [Tanacetum coccineum]